MKKSTPKKWGRLDGAFAFGFCSRCPSEDLLLELLNDCDHPISDRNFTQILSVRTQMMADFRSYESQGLDAGRYLVDFSHVSDLSSLCNLLFPGEDDQLAFLLYRLGAAVGDHIGMHLIKIQVWKRVPNSLHMRPSGEPERWQPSSEGLESIRAMLDSLPENYPPIFHSLVQILTLLESAGQLAAVMDQVADERGWDTQNIGSGWSLLDEIAQGLRQVERNLIAQQAASGSAQAACDPPANKVVRRQRQKPRLDSDDRLSLWAALQMHHKFDTAEPNYSPATQKQLGDPIGWHQSKVSRMMTKYFPGGMKGYKDACVNDGILTHLARLDGSSVASDS